MFPLHANVGTGTGIGTLIPIWPASTFRSKYRAVAPLLVKMDVPLPSAGGVSVGYEVGVRDVHLFRLIRSMAS